MDGPEDFSSKLAVAGRSDTVQARRVPEPRPHHQSREEVMFFDTDCGGVVHNIAYLRMIETCRTRLAAQLGMNLPHMVSQQLFPVVVRTEIDYIKPAKLGDWLIIDGYLGELSKARFWCEFQIIRDEDRTMLVQCRQALALVQMPLGKPIRLPAEWTQAWGKTSA